MQKKLSVYKEKAWRQFSIYIRTRDCLRTTFSVEQGTCCTCNQLYPFKQLQAGHFIDGRTNAVLFSEQGVHAQCDSCNRHKHGNKLKYWLFMERQYGRAIINKLIAESEQTIIYKRTDYERIAQTFQQKTATLLASPELAVLQN